MPRPINGLPRARPVPDAVARPVPDAAARPVPDEVLRRLANKKGAALYRAALELYEMLGNLNNDEREFIEGIFGRTELFENISSGTVRGLRTPTCPCPGGLGRRSITLWAL